MTDWNGARVDGLGANERLEFGEGLTRKGTSTDYGCCVMAMEAGGVTARTL